MYEENDSTRAARPLAAIRAEVERDSVPPNTMEERKRFMERTRRELGLPDEKDVRDLKDYISYDLLGGATMELYLLVPASEDKEQADGYLQKKLDHILTALGALWKKQNRQMAKPLRLFKDNQIGIRTRIWVDIDERTFAFHTWRIVFPYVVPKGKFIDYTAVPPFETKFDIEYDEKKKSSSVAFVRPRNVNTKTGHEVECIEK